MNRRHRFKQADIARAVKGATAAGLQIGRVEIDPEGRIVLVSREAEMAPPIADFDSWKSKRDARQP